jgi:hypothetical protein
VLQVVRKPGLENNTFFRNFRWHMIIYIEINKFF